MFVTCKYLSIKTSVLLEFLLRNQTQLKRVFEVSGSYYGEKLNKILLSDTADAKVIWKKIAILYVSVPAFKFSVNMDSLVIKKQEGNIKHSPSEPMSSLRFILAVASGEVCWTSTSADSHTHTHEQVNLASHTPLIPMMLNSWRLNRLLTVLTSSVRELLFRSLVILHFLAGRADEPWYKRHECFLKSLIQRGKGKWQAQIIHNHICKRCAISSRKDRYSTLSKTDLFMKYTVAWQESLLLLTIHVILLNSLLTCLPNQHYLRQGKIELSHPLYKEKKTLIHKNTSESFWRPSLKWPHELETLLELYLNTVKVVYFTLKQYSRWKIIRHSV